MQHLDEGTIHAWLDGQLPRDEAAQVEAHVAECRQCADAVAEARGLIAASSRILTALDGVPREVVPKQGVFRAESPAARAADVVADAFVPLNAPATRARRRWFNAASLAAAAAIIAAIGTFAVVEKRGDTVPVALGRARPTSVASGPLADSAPVAVATTPAAPAPSAAKPLGDARGAAADRQVAATPSIARDERDAASNEVARRAASDSGIDRVTVLKEAEVRALYGTPAGSPRISIRGQAALNVDTTANKPAERLAKDAKQEVQVAADAAEKEVAGGVIKGRVTDANNTGLANAMVTVNGTSSGVATNEAGEFSIAGVQGGAHRLAVRRLGYEPITRDITVAAGQTLQTDIVLTPATTRLDNVVVTGTSAAVAQSGARAKTAPAPKPAAPPADAPPGAPITAAQSNAVGCYDLGITALMRTRNTFSGMPRRIALDSEIVPANADGVWYRARDLARTNAQPNGLWRPTGPDGVEIEWTYGSRTARVRVTGPAGSIMRGNLEEIDRATANGEAASVVAVRRACEP
jgi:hypothetical protein